jgi:hypothetical protein
MNRPQRMHARIEFGGRVRRVGGKIAWWRHGLAFHSSGHAAPGLWLAHGGTDGARANAGLCHVVRASPSSRCVKYQSQMRELAGEGVGRLAQPALPSHT